MRTLALLAALLLLALQTQAKPRQETAEQVPVQDMPEAKDQDQFEADDQDEDQSWYNDQDMANTLAGADRLVRDVSDLRKVKFCICRKSICVCKKSSIN